MRKLAWRTTAVLALTTCFSTISFAQTTGSVEYYYAGPLDDFKSKMNSTNQGPLDTVAATSGPLYSVARLSPPKKLRGLATGVTSTIVGPISKEAMLQLTGGNSTPASIPEVQSVAPPAPLQVPTIPNQINLIEAPRPAFESEPANGSAEPVFTGPITQTRSFRNPQISLMNLPPAKDPTRFGYRDGESFRFDNTRLYNPLDGPQLELQGAPTAYFGPYGCDEWQGFCRANRLDYTCGCGGLKVNPGHLGLPWLGSKDNCDQTIPFQRKRSCNCQQCQTENGCEAGCDSCGGH